MAIMTVKPAMKPHEAWRGWLAWASGTSWSTTTKIYSEQGHGRRGGERLAQDVRSEAKRARAGPKDCAERTRVGAERERGK